MASTTFIPGTVITSAWLNDINTFAYGSITSIAILRTVLKTGAPNINVLGYYTAGDGGGGSYYYDATDTSSADNGGTIIVAADGGRWKLITGNSIDVKKFGARFDGVTDDTAAILACMTELYATPTGGTMILPRGTSVVNNLTFTFNDNNKSLNIRGQGNNSTILKKTSGDANPVFNFVGPASLYSDFTDFQILGNTKLGPGLRITQLARFTLTRLRIQACSTGLDNRGSLIFDVNDCYIESNVDGYVSRRSAPYSCNNITFNGGIVTSNTGYGFDIGDSSGFNVFTTDIERNGTLGNLATGDVNIRSTCDDESGSSQIAFNGTWHETNTGRGFTTEACSGLRLDLTNIRFDTNGSGNDANIGVIARLKTDNVLSNTIFNTAATTHISAASSFVTLNDTGATKLRFNSADSTTYLLFQIIAGALGSLSVDPNTGIVNVGAGGLVSTGNITVKGGSSLLTTGTSLTDVSASATATLTNAPTAGNPTKWIQINDNGITRKIPTWT